uniref:GLOBIN domain-containing protein n=1 Tax=Steinernema glaseri TaxID=37863 RepID=A0A1I7YAK6_9BILA
MHPTRKCIANHGGEQSAEWRRAIILMNPRFRPESVLGQLTRVLLQSNEQFYDVFNFSHVRMASKEEQMQDERITKHAETVMKMLDVVISNVKDADYMFQLLQKSGTDHAHRSHFRPEFFWKIEGPFLYAVKEILQDRYTENMDQIYRVIIKIVLSTLEESCRAELARIGGRNGS